MTKIVMVNAITAITRVAINKNSIDFFMRVNLRCP